MEHGYFLEIVSNYDSNISGPELIRMRRFLGYPTRLAPCQVVEFAYRINLRVFEIRLESKYSILFHSTGSGNDDGER
jgi:hypothetical protein